MDCSIVAEATHSPLIQWRTGSMAGALVLSIARAPLAVCLPRRRSPVDEKLRSDTNPSHRDDAGLHHACNGGLLDQLIPRARGVQHRVHVVSCLACRERDKRETDFGRNPRDEQLFSPRLLHRRYEVLVVPRVDLARPMYNRRLWKPFY